MINRKELFDKWCKKLTQTPEQLEEEYNKRTEEDKTVHADLTEEERDKYILSVMQGFYKRQFMSPAKPFEGTIIGIMPKFDTVRRIRKTAIELHAKDPEKAISEGYTDNEGTPLYLTPEWKKGKPVPDTDYNRTLIALAFRTGIENQNPKIYPMSMRGAKADLLPPMFQKVAFRAGMSKDESSLNSAEVTEFKDLNSPVNFKKLAETLPDNFVPLKKLKEWVDEHADSEGRIGFTDFIITKGTASRINIPDNQQYSKAILTITDLDLGFLTDDEKGDDIIEDITCWVGLDTPDIAFGEGSIIYVIGRPAVGKEGAISINTYGIWADPKFITGPATAPQPVTPETVQPKIISAKELVNDKNIPEPEDNQW